MLGVVRAEINFYLTSDEVSVTFMAFKGVSL